VASDESGHTAIDPDAILRQPFGTVRKGYDPLEVQKYLMALAGELRAGRVRERDLERRVADAERRAEELEHLSPQRLTEMLGEETAKVIEAANSAAADIRAKAEENVARLLRDAHDESARIRQEAETVLERKTKEAEAAAETLRAQGEELLQKARAEADAVAEQGAERGREMVSEAERLRERVLRDLARRRKTLRQQIEQLQAGRDRMIAAFAVVRKTLDAATDELDVVLPEAKAAADAALQRFSESDETLDAELAALTAEVDAALGIEPEPTVSSNDGDANGDGTDDDGHTDGPRAPDPIAGRHSSAVTVIHQPEEPPSSDAASDDTPAEPAATDAGNAEADRPTRAEPPATATTTATAAPATAAPAKPQVPTRKAAVEEPGSAARMTDLFARIRREATIDEAHGEAAARVALVSGSASAPPDDGPLSRGDEIGRVLAELARALGRGVKRELAEQQNQLLDAVRRETTANLDDVLPPTEDHVERVVSAATSALADAAMAGAVSLATEARASEEPPRVSAIARDVAAELAAELVAPLRGQLAAAFAESADEDAASEAVRAVYREWRAQRIDAAAAHAVVVAFNRGVLVAVRRGATVEWLPTEATDCAECRGNAGAGGVVAGQPFPSGHEAPPGHEGCRCVLVGMSADDPAGAADR
jgi:cell division septum initiation protein DivIVA